MKFFTLTIVLSIFSLGAVADSIFETVALNSEYLVADTQTEVKLLGSLSNGYRIYNYRNYFNNGNRATTRIVAINSKSELVGLYGINDWAIKLTGDCIIFPYSKDVGNSICLKENKLPAQAWVDGENPMLFK